MAIREFMYMVYVNDEPTESFEDYQDCLEFIKKYGGPHATIKYQILKYTLSPSDITATPFYSREEGAK